MRITVTLDDELLHSAKELTGIEQHSLLVQQSLLALIEKSSARKLAQLGGSEDALRPIPRRRL